MLSCHFASLTSNIVINIIINNSINYARDNYCINRLVIKYNADQYVMSYFVSDASSWTTLRVKQDLKVWEAAQSKPIMTSQITCNNMLSGTDDLLLPCTGPIDIARFILCKPYRHKVTVHDNFPAKVRIAVLDGRARKTLWSLKHEKFKKVCSIQLFMYVSYPLTYHISILC